MLARAKLPRSTKSPAWQEIEGHVSAAAELAAQESEATKARGETLPRVSGGLGASRILM